MPLESQLFKSTAKPQVTNTVPRVSGRKFLVFSEFGELLDLAMALKDQGNEVLMHIPSDQWKKIGEGMVEKEKDWYRRMGEGWTWVFDSCAYGNLQDWLREQGEFVIGGTEEGDDLENDRQLGQKLFKKAGFYQPMSKNFKDIGQAIQFVEQNKDKRWILKQNGDAPKSLNHMGHFDGSEDMLFHLNQLKKSWNESQFGQFDCDLMEVVEGLELAASGFFNGHDYLRNKDGKVVGYLNFEEKKEANGGTGETTGEMGTTFIGVTEDNKLFKEILMKPEIIGRLTEMDYRGVFDINCIKTDKGIVALEPTMRFGIPATSYELIEGLKTPAAKVLDAMAKGLDVPIEIHEGAGMVMCVVAKPFPSEADMDDEATSIGEKLWILEKGKVRREFSWDQKKHVHLYNFEKSKDKETMDLTYKVATKSGYLLTVTGRGNSISETRESMVKYIKDNLYISGIKYRTDIGERLEKYGYH